MGMYEHSKNTDSERNKRGLNRRSFIRYSAAAGAGFLASMSGTRGLLGRWGIPLAHGAQSADDSQHNSRVIVARNGNLFGTDQNLKQQEVEWTLSAGMGSLFGTNEPVKAWRNLFKPDDVVGIKVNCIAGPELSSHPRVVAAIVSELQKVDIPAENIIIWDRTNRELRRAGYSVNIADAGVRCYGTDAVGYEDTYTRKGSFNGRISTILTKKITALINVPILKNHGGAGVTIAMKNHYGSIHNPGSHHGNGCDPYIADLNSVDEIKAKTRLIICDATRPTCDGGPSYKPAFVWQYSGLILSTDPVALDTVGTQIIDDRRAELGLPRLAETGRHPRHLVSAAERGLGTASLRAIDLRAVTL